MWRNGRRNESARARPRGLIRLWLVDLFEVRGHGAGDRRRASVPGDGEDVITIRCGRADCQCQRRGNRGRIRAEVPGRSRREAAHGESHR